MYVCSHIALEALFVRFFRGGALKLQFSCYFAFKLKLNLHVCSLHAIYLFSTSIGSQFNTNIREIHIHTLLLYQLC